MLKSSNETETANDLIFAMFSYNFLQIKTSKLIRHYIKQFYPSKFLGGTSQKKHSVHRQNPPDTLKNFRV